MIAAIGLGRFNSFSYPVGENSTFSISPMIDDDLIWLFCCITGATHLTSCTIQPHIPIYLIVLGANSILSLTLTYTSSAFDDGAIHVLSTACMTVLHIFSFAWFIAGGRKKLSELFILHEIRHKTHVHLLASLLDTTF